MKSNVLYRTQHAIVLHYLFSIVSRGIAMEFSRVLREGDGNMERPFVVFREMILRTPHRTDLRRSHAARAIKAFNAEIRCDRPKMLKFHETEEFPRIAGFDYEKLTESIS
jgi:hypothetical protein